MKKQTPVFDKYVSDYRGIHTQNIHNVSGVDSAYFCEFSRIYHQTLSGV